MKNTAILLLSVCGLLVGACTSSFQSMRESLAQAPDWYDQRRQEIRGEGYPDLAEVPVVSASVDQRAFLAVSEERVALLKALFDANARAVSPADLHAETEAFLQDVRLQFAGLPPEPAFLTQEDVQAIRARFQVPRVTEGLRAASP